MNRFQNYLLNALAFSIVTLVGCVFGALVILGRLLERYDHRSQVEILKRLRCGR